MLSYVTCHLIIPGPLGVCTLKLLNFAVKKIQKRVAIISECLFYYFFFLNGVASRRSSVDSSQETNESRFSY